MDSKLQQLVDRFFKIADIRNINDDNPIKITLENPNLGGNTIIIVAVLEPHDYPLPFNVIWIVADANSHHYRVPFKRQAKSPSANTPQWLHTWVEVLTYYDFFNPAQYADPDEETENEIKQQLLAHINNHNNPHQVTAIQVEALSVHGGRMEGPLFLHRMPEDVDEAASRAYVDLVAQNLSSSMTAITHAVIDQAIHIDDISLNLENVNQGIYQISNQPNRALGFRYIKSVPVRAWVINHNLDTDFIVVSVYGAEGTAILPDDICKINSNTAIVYFLVPFSGTASVSGVLA